MFAHISSNSKTYNQFSDPFRVQYILHLKCLGLSLFLSPSQCFSELFAGNVLGRVARAARCDAAGVPIDQDICDIYVLTPLDLV